MLIQCTKALLDRLKVNQKELQSHQGYEQFPESLMAWHANLVRIDRRKAVVLMNNETRYPVVIYRPAPKDFSKMKELIAEAITTALRMEGVREDVMASYMNRAGEIQFSKTGSRSLVAKMNNTAREMAYARDYLDEGTRIQRYISIKAGRFIQGSQPEEFFYPVEKMLDSLGVFCGTGKQEHVLDVERYRLKIRIEIEGFDIWRRVLVPSTYSFRHLHNIIQTIFDWQNYHLHQFQAEKEGAGSKLIVMDDDPEMMEWVDFDALDVLQEQFVALKDIFPEYKRVNYEYDFGDSWEHTITLEGTVRSNTFDATYLEGSGERPPEDVGGSMGYEDYMAIMADETDPEHESMKVWAESQKERNFSPEDINNRLKRTFVHYTYW